MSVIADSNQCRIVSLQLYRHLLRACTYLPDSVARREISQQVKSRFRKSRSRILEQRSSGSSTDCGNGVQDERSKIKRYLITGFRALKTLRNAGNGALQSLRTVLKHAYGRSGKRRHYLLAPLLHSKEPLPPVMFRLPIHGKAMVEIPDIYIQSIKGTKDTHVIQLSDRFEKFKNLALAQSAAKDLLDTRNQIKKVDPQIPARNTWDRSMPLKRIKNASRRHRDELMKRILPPLPPNEWLRLYQLASGKMHEPLPIRRSKIPSATSRHLNSRDLADAVHILASTRLHAPSELSMLPMNQQLKRSDSTSSWTSETHHQDLAKSDFLQEELLLRARFAVTHNFSNDNHTITPRFMRRQWAAILQQCPRTQSQAAEMTGVFVSAREATRVHLDVDSQRAHQNLFDLVDS